MDAGREPRQREEPLLSSADDDARIGRARGPAPRGHRGRPDPAVRRPRRRSRSDRRSRPGSGRSGRAEEAGMRRVNIGLLGCGTVGRGFVELLGRERERIRARDGVDVSLRRILVRDVAKVRPEINPALFTASAIDVLDDGCDIIVELVGGVHSAGRTSGGAAERPRRRHGEQSASCRRWPRVICNGRETWSAHRIRGQRLRRNPDHRGAAARTGRRPDRIDQRNPQRDLQLHSDQDGAG